MWSHNKHGVSLCIISCIYFVIIYCLSAWGEDFPVARRQKLLIGITRESFLICSVGFFLHVIKSVTLLQLVDIYRLIVAIYMYKIIKLNKLINYRPNSTVVTCMVSNCTTLSGVSSIPVTSNSCLVHPLGRCLCGS